MENAYNCCRFIGRIASKQNVVTRQGNNGEYKTLMLSMAVDRNLTKDQRNKAKNDNSIKTCDFVPLSASGGIVDFIEQWCPVGRAVIVTAHYETYEKTNQQTGQKEYGHTFRIDSINFSVADSKNLQNNTNNGNNSNNTNNQNNNQGFSMFDEKPEVYDSSMNPMFDNNQSFDNNQAF